MKSELSASSGNSIRVSAGSRVSYVSTIAEGSEEADSKANDRPRFETDVSAAMDNFGELLERQTDLIRQVLENHENILTYAITRDHGFSFDSAARTRQSSSASSASPQRAPSPRRPRAEDAVSCKDSMVRRQRQRLQSRLISQPSFIYRPISIINRTELERIRHPEVHVSDFYAESGWLPCIVKHAIFDYASIAMLILNFFWLGVDIDLNPAFKCDSNMAPWGFQVVNHSFCTFFFFEFWARFFACEIPRTRAFGDLWFAFDFLLMSLITFDMWAPILCSAVLMHSSWKTAFRFTRVFRLARLARGTRIIQAIPELAILFKGMVVGMRSVFGLMLMLMMLIYSFAIAFTQLRDLPVDDQEYLSVHQTVHYLVIYGIFPDQYDFIQRNLVEHDWPWNAIYYTFSMVYLFVSALTLMNMLIGVICEAMGVVANVERFKHSVSAVYRLVDSAVHSCGLERKHQWEKQDCAQLQQQLVFMYSNFNEHGMDIKHMLHTLSKPAGCSRDELYDVLDGCLANVDHQHRVKADAIMVARATATSSSTYLPDIFDESTPLLAAGRLISRRGTHEI